MTRAILDKVTPESIKRFWNKVDKSNPDGCWLWTASRHWKGYGYFGVERTRIVYAHRFSWVIHFGEIPEGMFACHKCDNPSCVRPDHLFLGTDGDNKRDMRSKGRMATGENAGQAKLTNAKVLELRERYLSGETYRSLAIDVGLSFSAMLDVLMLRSYRDAPTPDGYGNRKVRRSRFHSTPTS